MQAFQRRSITAHRWRAAIASVLAVNHLRVASGAPLPLGSSEPPAAREMYPCMDCRCGCHSAEQCWRNCCCYTMTQKLAWAKEHGVAPPSFVVAEAEKEARAACANHGGCPHCHKCGQADSASDAKRDEKSVVLLRALGCRGTGPAGLLSSLPALPIVHRQIMFDLLPAIDAVIYPAVDLPAVFADIPVPPPRLTAS